MTEYLKYKLNPDEKIVYAEILNGTRNNKSEIIISYTPNCDLEKIYQHFMYDHPELYNVSPQFSMTSVGNRAIMNMKYIYDRYTAKQIDAKIKDVVNKLKQQIDMVNDLVEKEKIIIEYLVRNVEYQIDNLKNQNAASALYFGKAQCSGFASAFKYLCDVFGIWCMSVFGEYNNKKALVSGPHAWNIVKLGNDYYNVDVTMMQGANTNNKDKLYYFGINCSDLKFLQHYIWDHRVYPKCTKDMEIK